MEPSPAVRRLLSAFETPAAAERFVARVRESPEHDLERIARMIVEVAEAAPAPDTVLGTVAGMLADERTPLGPEDAIGGMTLLVTAECERQSAAERLRARAAAERAAAGSLRATALWHESPNDRATFEALMSVATTSDVDDLIDACAGDPGKGHDTVRLRAAALLARLAQNGDGRFGAEARRRWAGVIGPLIVDPQQLSWKQGYLVNAWAAIDSIAAEQALFDLVSTHGVYGARQLDVQILLSAIVRSASDAAAGARRSELFGNLVRLQIAKGRAVSPLVVGWQSVDAPAASRFLTEEWPLDGVSDALKLQLVGALAALGTERARARLLTLRAEPGRVGDRATAALELLGEIPPDGLDALVDEWRRQPTRDVLTRFHNRYIDGMEAGVPMATWAERLAPRSSGDSSLTLTTPDGGYLFLDFDERGNMIGWKFN